VQTFARVLAFDADAAELDDRATTSPVRMRKRTAACRVEFVRLKLIAPGRPLRAHNSAAAPAKDMALIALRVLEP
jgi:hypothetical protein